MEQEIEKERLRQEKIELEKRRLQVRSVSQLNVSLEALIPGAEKTAGLTERCQPLLPLSHRHHPHHHGRTPPLSRLEPSSEHFLSHQELTSAKHRT